MLPEINLASSSNDARVIASFLAFAACLDSVVRLIARSCRKRTGARSFGLGAISKFWRGSSKRWHSHGDTPVGGLRHGGLPKVGQRPYRQGEILIAIKGIDSEITGFLIAEFPDFGSPDKGQIAKLLGVAPTNRDSSLMRGKRMIAGRTKAGKGRALHLSITANPLRSSKAV